MSEVQPETSAQATPPPTFATPEASVKTAETKTQPDAPATVDTPEPKPTEASKADAKEGEAKPTEEKPESKESESKDKPAPPEKYELKLSENSLLDQSAIDRVAAFAKAQGLSQEAAAEALKTQEQDVAAFIEDRKAQWKDQTLKDKEIGGEALKENIVLANKMLERFATPELKKELTRTGYGNHPELVRMLVKIGKASADDKAVIPRTHTKNERSMADVFYDNPKSNHT